MRRCPWVWAVGLVLGCGGGGPGGDGAAGGGQNHVDPGDTNPGPGPQIDLAPRELLDSPYRGLPRWCKGATHVHTRDGSPDAVDTAAAMMAAYAAQKYDFMFITDHDALTIPSGPQPLLVFPGEEVTTDWGHANAFGIARIIPKVERQDDAIALAEAAGGIMQRNHPSRNDNTTREKLDSWQGLWGIEVGNELNGAPGDVLLWDGQLAQGKRLWGTFGDDAHDAGVAGWGWISINTDAPDCNLQAVLDAMRSGSFIMSEGPSLRVTTSGATITVSTDAVAATIEWYQQGPALLRRTEAGSDSYTLAGGELFVRIELRDQAGKRAWSQPLFVKH